MKILSVVDARPNFMKMTPGKKGEVGGQKSEIRSQKSD
jgi:hypothetical protein